MSYGKRTIVKYYRSSNSMSKYGGLDMGLKKKISKAAPSSKSQNCKNQIGGGMELSQF
jgi:hypothetical protein